MTQKLRHKVLNRLGNVSGLDWLALVAVLAIVCVEIPHLPNGGFRQQPFLVVGLALDFGRYGVPLLVCLVGFYWRSHSITRECEPHQRDWSPRFSRRLYATYAGGVLLGLLAIAATAGVSTMAVHLVRSAPVHLVGAQNLLSTSPSGVGNRSLWVVALLTQLYLIGRIALKPAPTSSWRVPFSVAVVVASAWSILTVDQLREFVPLSQPVLAEPRFWPIAFLPPMIAGVCLADRVHLQKVNIRPSWQLAWPLVIVAVIATDWRTAYFVRHAHLLDSLSLPATLPAWITTSLMTGVNVIATSSACVLLLAPLVASKSDRTRAADLPSPLMQFAWWLLLTHGPVLYCLNEWFPANYTGPTSEWVLRYALYVPITLIVGWFGFKVAHSLFHPVPFASASKSQGPSDRVPVGS